MDAKWTIKKVMCPQCVHLWTHDPECAKGWLSPGSAVLALAGCAFVEQFNFVVAPSPYLAKPAVAGAAFAWRCGGLAILAPSSVGWLGMPIGHQPSRVAQAAAPFVLPVRVSRDKAHVGGGHRVHQCFQDRSKSAISPQPSAASRVSAASRMGESHARQNLQEPEKQGRQGRSLEAAQDFRRA